MSTDFTSIVAGFSLTLGVAAMALALGVLAWMAIRRRSPRPVLIDSVLMLGSVLVGYIYLGLGDSSGLAKGTQMLLLGLYVGRVWARYEATGRIFPSPQPAHPKA